MRGLSLLGGRIIDPATGRDEVGDVFLDDGVIVERPSLGANELDCTGRIVCPGFIELHAALREPGHEDDETIATGTAAALAGGFSTVACLPNTIPAVDSQAAAEFVSLQAERAGNCRVLPLGAVTKDHAGTELAEIGQLVKAGAVGFTDAERTVANAEHMRRALEYTSMFNKPVMNRPQNPELAAEGVMHEGAVSALLGLRGIPAAAEEIVVHRDLALTAMTGGRLHSMSISCTAAVEAIRKAKADGIKATCDVTPAHLLLTDDSLRTFDSNYKVDPPFRTDADIAALIARLQDGTIDALSSDHQPFAAEKKSGDLDSDPFGIVGLETAFALAVRALVEPEHIGWAELIALFTTGPARVLGLTDRANLLPGGLADVTIFDPESRYEIDPKSFRSMSRNTPFGGWTVTARVTHCVVGGEVRFPAGLFES